MKAAWNIGSNIGTAVQMIVDREIIVDWVAIQQPNCTEYVDREKTDIQRSIEGVLRAALLDGAITVPDEHVSCDQIVVVII